MRLPITTLFDLINEQRVEYASGILNFELTQCRHCLLDPPRETAPLIFLPALAPMDGRARVTSVAIVRVCGTPGSRLEGQRI